MSAKYDITCKRCGAVCVSRVRFMCMPCYTNYPGERYLYRDRPYSRRRNNRYVYRGICPECKREDISLIRNKSVCGRCVRHNPQLLEKYPLSERYRAWTTKELKTLREFVWSKRPVDEIARVLNRSRNSVNGAIARFNLGYKFTITPAIERKVRHLCRPGRSDTEVGLMVGLPQGTVRGIRQRHGIKAGLTRAEAAKRAGLAAYKKSGIWPFTMRYERQRMEAAHAGWPPGCSHAHRVVLEALKAGARTTKEISAVTGRKNGNTNFRLRELVKLKWVIRVSKVSSMYTYRLNETLIHQLLLDRGSSKRGKVERSGRKSRNFVADWHEAG